MLIVVFIILYQMALKLEMVADLLPLFIVYWVLAVFKWIYNMLKD